MDKDIIAAKELLRKEGFFVQNMWQSDDVIEMALTNHNIELTKEQCIEVFDFIGRTHNAEIGVNWDVIDNAIEELFVNI